MTTFDPPAKSKQQLVLEVLESGACEKGPVTKEFLGQCTKLTSRELQNTLSRLMRRGLVISHGSPTSSKEKVYATAPPGTPSKIPTKAKVRNPARDGSSKAAGAHQQLVSSIAEVISQNTLLASALRDIIKLCEDALADSQ